MVLSERWVNEHMYQPRVIMMKEKNTTHQREVYCVFFLVFMQFRHFYPMPAISWCGYSLLFSSIKLRSECKMWKYLDVTLFVCLSCNFMYDISWYYLNCCNSCFDSVIIIHMNTNAFMWSNIYTSVGKHSKLDFRARWHESVFRGDKSTSKLMV